MRGRRLGAALLTVAALTAGCGGDDDPSRAGAAVPPPVATSGAPLATVPPPPTSTPATDDGDAAAEAGWKQPHGPRPPVRVGDISLVARARAARIGVYAAPAAPAPALTLCNPLTSGAPLVFLVQERRGDRLRVLLPVRPHGSRGWIRASGRSVGHGCIRMRDADITRLAKLLPLGVPVQIQR